MGMRPQCALPLPMGEVPQLATWGGEAPLSHGLQPCQLSQRESQGLLSEFA